MNTMNTTVIDKAFYYGLATKFCVNVFDDVQMIRRNVFACKNMYIYIFFKPIFFLVFLILLCKFGKFLNFNKLYKTVNNYLS